MTISKADYCCKMAGCQWMNSTVDIHFARSTAETISLCKAKFALGAASNQLLLFAPTTAVATPAHSLPQNRVLRRLCVVRLHDWPIWKLVFLGALRRPPRTAAGDIHRAGFYGCLFHRVRLVDHLLVGPRLPVRRTTLSRC